MILIIAWTNKNLVHSLTKKNVKWWSRDMMDLPQSVAVEIDTFSIWIKISIEYWNSLLGWGPKVSFYKNKIYLPFDFCIKLKKNLQNNFLGSYQTYHINLFLIQTESNAAVISQSKTGVNSQWRRIIERHLYYPWSKCSLANACLD